MAVTAARRPRRRPGRRLLAHDRDLGRAARGGRRRGRPRLRSPGRSSPRPCASTSTGCADPVRRRSALLDDSKRHTDGAPRGALRGGDRVRGAGAVCVIPASEIDRRGLHRSNLHALGRALLRARPRAATSASPTGSVCPAARGRIAPWSAATARSAAIAAASIVAKVTRDRFMRRIAPRYPGFGFEQHVGYITPEHTRAVRGARPDAASPAVVRGDRLCAAGPRSRPLSTGASPRRWPRLWLRLRGYRILRPQRPRRRPRGRRRRAARPHARRLRGEGPPQRPSRDAGRGGRGAEAAAAAEAGEMLLAAHPGVDRLRFDVIAVDGLRITAHSRGLLSGSGARSRRARDTRVARAVRTLGWMVARALTFWLMGITARRVEVEAHLVDGVPQLRGRRPGRPGRPGGAPARAQRHHLGGVPLPGHAPHRQPGARAGAQGGIRLRPRDRAGGARGVAPGAASSASPGSLPRPSSASTGACGPCGAPWRWPRRRGGPGSRRSSWRPRAPPRPVSAAASRSSLPATSAMPSRSCADRAEPDAGPRAAALGRARPAPTSPRCAASRGRGGRSRSPRRARHNLLMTGPPGSGKTMLARRLPGHPAAARPGEALEITRIHSAAGLLAPGTLRPLAPVPGPAPQRVGGRAGRERPPAARRGQPGPPRRALHGRAARVHAAGARGPADAARGAARAPGPRARRRDAARPLHRRRGDEPLPVRHGGRPRPGVHVPAGQRRAPTAARISGPLLDRFDLRVEAPRAAAHAAGGEASAVVRARVVAARAALAAQARSRSTPPRRRCSTGR